MQKRSSKERKAPPGGRGRWSKVALICFLQDRHASLVEVDFSKELLELLDALKRHLVGSHFVFAAVFQDVAGCLRLARVLREGEAGFDGVRKLEDLKTIRQGNFNVVSAHKRRGELISIVTGLTGIPGSC